MFRSCSMIERATRTPASPNVCLSGKTNDLYSLQVILQRVLARKAARCICLPQCWYSRMCSSTTSKQCRATWDSMFGIFTASSNEFRITCAASWLAGVRLESCEQLLHVRLSSDPVRRQFLAERRVRWRAPEAEEWEIWVRRPAWKMVLKWEALWRGALKAREGQVQMVEL